MNDTIIENIWVRVRLDPTCPGGSRPHHPAEHGVRGVVTAIGKPGDHSVFILFKGGRAAVFPPPGGLGLGRYYRPDELEPIPEPAERSW
jgi:hypothetical protein